MGRATGAALKSRFMPPSMILRHAASVLDVTIALVRFALLSLGQIGTTARRNLTTNLESHMTPNHKLLAFDVDKESLDSLHEAFPGWEIEVGADRSRLNTWNPTDVDLLVVGMDKRAGQAFGLCRLLRQQQRWEKTPLLVIVPPGRPTLRRDSGS
jgi:hypothetical protein